MFLCAISAGILYLYTLKACTMIDYTPKNQLSIFEFETPFKKVLSFDNRWVMMRKNVP
jgi:hypothetical protein